MRIQKLQPQVWYFLLALAVALAVSVLNILATMSVNHGWDARIFCSAARVSQAGHNPYDVQELQQELSWNYLPYLLPVFEGICPAPLHFEKSYPVIYAALLLASIVTWRPGSDWLLAVTLAVGGLAGFSWVLTTGNLTVFELLLLSITILLLAHRRWEWAGLSLGIMASLKLITLPYVGLLLFIPESNSRRLRTLAISLIAFASTFALSSALFPSLMQPFLEQILGLIPNQHNVWVETGAMNNVPLAFLVTDLVKLTGLSLPVPVSITVGTGVAGAAIVWICRKINLPRLASQDYLSFFSIGLIALSLVLPRLKPYSLLLLVPALFILLRGRGRKWQSRALIISTILPSILFLMRLYSSMDSPIKMLLLTYSPTICVLATLALLVSCLPAPDPSHYAGTSRS